MYEIRPETVKTFVLDRNIKLPRFQRKQTWNEKKNFQLCISLFKEYPMGVTILSVEEKGGKTVRWLLDGRQRRNALLQMYEDPENIYIWAKKFIGFKNSNQPSEIDDQFWGKINEYIEYDEDEGIEDSTQEEADITNSVENIDCSVLQGNTGLDFLLEIIKIFHNKTQNNNGFTKPFDVCSYVNKIPYVDNNRGANSLSSKRLKNFIDEYRNYCNTENCDYEDLENLYHYFDSRCEIVAKEKLKQHIELKKGDILSRMNIIERIDNLLSNSKIGLIEVKNLTPVDSQKIFNIINTEGEKLTAVEVLSAKPSWNVKINNVSEETNSAVGDLYKRIGTNNTDVVKWDLPATLLRRIGNNFIVRQFGDDKATDFAKEITYGFKLIAGIWNSGVKKENYEALSSDTHISWANGYEELVYDLKNMLNLMGSFSYFKFFKSWRTTIMDLTSESISLNFFILMYLDWKRKGKPIGNDVSAKQFGKNCLILWDRLIYEYVSAQWKGSADAKIANNIATLRNAGDVFEPISSEKWLALFDEIEESAKVFGNNVSQKLMEPILYHFYCLKSIESPGFLNSIEVDHIIPQALFKNTTIPNSETIVDSIYNLGLLPKNENASKSNRRLIEITDEWLKSQIEKYEFITEDNFGKYSDVGNYKQMYEKRKQLFIEAFGPIRFGLLNN